VRLALRPDTAQLWVMTAIVTFTVLAALWLRLSQPPPRPRHRRLEDEPSPADSGRPWEPLAWWEDHVSGQR
jgi:hypothetical protein